MTLDEKPHKDHSVDRNGRGSASLTTSVYDLVREDVLFGRLPPGAKLRIETLRARYAVGATPLREALTRLAGDGLIIHEEQKGFRVATVSRAEMHELIRTRCWLEAIALQQSIAHGDEQWEEAILLTHRRLSKRSRSTQPDSFSPNLDWGRQHRAFHLALIGACGSRWLLQYCTQLHDQADRYRCIAGVVSYPDRDELAEHTAIMDATLERDAANATRLLHAHYERTAAIIAAAIPEAAHPPADRVPA